MVKSGVFHVRTLSRRFFCSTLWQCIGQEWSFSLHVPYGLIALLVMVGVDPLLVPLLCSTLWQCIGQEWRFSLHIRTLWLDCASRHGRGVHGQEWRFSMYVPYQGDFLQYLIMAVYRSRVEFFHERTLSRRFFVVPYSSV